jgi:DNA-binding NtrC family response regulator
MLWRKGEDFDKPKIGPGETILVVEDDKGILNLGSIILEELGYRVLKANSPCEAPQLAKRCTHEIDLLITDVIMLEMNGNELSQHPILKLMYMSGYSGDVIARHGVFNEKAHFLQKPFASKELSVKVREIVGDKSKS